MAGAKDDRRDAHVLGANANESAGRFQKALRDAHRWLDELLDDPTQTIELLAVREGKSERSIRMTLSLAFISPVLAEVRDGGSSSARVLRKRLTDGAWSNDGTLLPDVENHDALPSFVVQAAAAI